MLDITNILIQKELKRKKKKIKEVITPHDPTWLRTVAIPPCQLLSLPASNSTSFFLSCIGSNKRKANFSFFSPPHEHTITFAFSITFQGLCFAAESLKTIIQFLSNVFFFFNSNNKLKNLYKYLIK